MDNCIKNCSNCKHRDKFITEDPCMDCMYSENWEPKEDTNEDSGSDSKS